MMPRLLRLVDVRQTAVAEAPAGYRLAMTVRLDLDRLSRLSFLGLVIAVPLFVLVTAPVGGPIGVHDGGLEVRIGPAQVAVAVVVVLIVLPVPHELVHGMVASVMGARPVYGIVLPIAAFCHFERFVTKSRYAAIVAAPLAVISLGGVALMPIVPPWLRGALLVLMIANASGSVGDLWLLWQLRSVPARALIADTAVGFEAYLESDATSADVAG